MQMLVVMMALLLAARGWPWSVDQYGGDNTLGLGGLEVLFAVWGFLFQAVLIAHFSLRIWAFDRYTRQFGWLVCAMSIPSVAVSLILLV